MIDEMKKQFDKSCDNTINFTNELMQNVNVVANYDEFGNLHSNSPKDAAIHIATSHEKHGETYIDVWNVHLNHGAIMNDYPFCIKLDNYSNHDSWYNYLHHGTTTNTSPYLDIADAHFIVENKLYTMHKNNLVVNVHKENESDTYINSSLFVDKSGAFVGQDYLLELLYLKVFCKN